MFGLAFRFPAGRYHATPWGRNVNGADVAWPPEPWRILRALVASYWRKGDRSRWGRDDLARLVEALAWDLPVFRLPEGAVHAHTRHYMPKRKAMDKTLVFDAFLHLPNGAEVVATWPGISLPDHVLALARDLADGIGYLGRAESWTECRVVSEDASDPNCVPAESGAVGDLVRVLVPRSSTAYSAERQRLLRQEEQRVREGSARAPSERQLRSRVARSFRAKGGADTLPEQLLDALSLDTADLQSCGWGQPPAAYEAIYARSSEAAPGVIPRVRKRSRKGPTMVAAPNRRPLSRRGPSPPPHRGRRQDRRGHAGRRALKVRAGHRRGDRQAAASRAVADLGPRRGESAFARPHAPPRVLAAGGRRQRRLDRPHSRLRRRGHGSRHTVASRPDHAHLARLAPVAPGTRDDPGVDEWRLALEGFGLPEDFAGASRILASSRRWQSLTPFLAPGHLRKAGYEGEVRRLLRRRGFRAETVAVDEIDEIDVGGTPRRALNFHRFRSRGRERRSDSSGALLKIELPEEVSGPLALGYGSHFGLGMFGSR